MTINASLSYFFFYQRTHRNREQSIKQLLLFICIGHMNASDAKWLNSQFNKCEKQITQVHTGLRIKVVKARFRISMKSLADHILQRKFQEFETKNRGNFAAITGNSKIRKSQEDPGYISYIIISLFSFFSSKSQLT